MHVRPKRLVHIHLPCINPKAGGRNTSSNVHYGAEVRGNTKISCRKVRDNYQLLSTGIMKGPKRHYTNLPVRPRRNLASMFVLRYIIQDNLRIFLLQEIM